MSCPQNQAEFEDYFFNLINRSKGAPADDWAEVMSREYNWNGTMMVIPPGVGPGVILPSDAPFYGLTQQWSDGPKARVFLPAAEKDHNGYFTCQIQYIRRVNPDGVSPTHVWDFDHTDGHPYVPICGDSEQPSDLEARVAALEGNYAVLEERLYHVENRVTALEQKTGNKKVALRSLANGRVVAAEINSSKVLVANREAIGPWEEFELIELE
jgi:hypothetical protein